MASVASGKTDSASDLNHHMPVSDHSRHIPHMATIVDEDEAQFRKEDLARSEAMASTVTTGYASSWPVWACSFAISLAVTSTYWNFVLPANAVPFIVATLGTSDNTSLFSIIWSLSIAVGLLIYGRLSDAFGRKKFVIGGLIMGATGSAVAGTAKNINTLVGAQVLIGLGGVPMIAYVLFCEIAPDRYKFLWLLPTFALSIIPTGAGAVIANSIARIRPDGTGWRLLYYICIALQLTAAIIIFFCYHPPTFRQIHGTHRTVSQELKRLDFLGFFLLIVGATLFILGVSWGGQPSPWSSPKILALLIVGIVFLLGFVAWETMGNARMPLVPPRIFREIKGFPLLIVIGTVNRIVYTSANIIWPSQVATIFFAADLAEGRWHTAAWTTSCVGFGILSLLIIVAPLMDVIRRTRLTMIVLSAWVVAFFGALLCITPDKLKEGQAFAFLALAPVGVLQDYVLVFAQFACRPQEIGVVICLLYFIQTFFASVFTSVFITILQNKLPGQVIKYVNQAALANGFPEANLAALDTAALTAPATLSSVDGMTDSVLAAVSQAIPFAYSKAYQYVTAAGFSICVVGLIAAIFMPSYDEYFTDKVQRPAYRHASDAKQDLLEGHSIDEKSGVAYSETAPGVKHEA